MLGTEEDFEMLAAGNDEKTEVGKRRGMVRASNLSLGIAMTRERMETPGRPLNPLSIYLHQSAFRMLLDEGHPCYMLRLERRTVPGGLELLNAFSYKDNPSSSSELPKPSETTGETTGDTTGEIPISSEFPMSDFPTDETASETTDEIVKSPTADFPTAEIFESWIRDGRECAAVGWPSPSGQVQPILVSVSRPTIAFGVNLSNIAMAMKWIQVMGFRDKSLKNEEVGIICNHPRQLQCYRRVLDAHNLPEVSVGSPVDFEGRELKVIIWDTVVTAKNVHQPGMDEEDQVTTASRHTDVLLVLGDQSVLGALREQKIKLRPMLCFSAMLTRLKHNRRIANENDSNFADGNKIIGGFFESDFVY